MNLNPFAALRARREERAAILDESSPIYQLFAGLGRSASGISVTQDSALTSVAVLGCLIVRAETFASLPVDVIRRSGRERLEVDKHPVAQLLTGQWNETTNAVEGLRWKQLTEDLGGNAYARIEWRRGNPVALWPLVGMKPAVHRAPSGRIFYRYSGDDFTPAGDYWATDILHFKGPVLKSPFEGKSLIELARETIGLSIGTEQFYARLLGNGTHFPAYLQTDKDLRKEDVDRLAEQLKDASGLLPAGELRIFDRGLKVMQNAMSIKDADLTVEQRWLLEQICRVFRVPKSLVQDWSQNTYSNAEQADLWFAKHTIRPICVNTEAVLRSRLFLESEADLRIKFNLDGLLRGDFKTRAEGYSLLINSKIINPNEARAFEDWNPYDGGDEYVGNAALESAGGDKPGAPLPPEDPGSAMQVLVDDAEDRIRRRAEQDRERGRDEADTRAFALRVLAPIGAVYARLGAVLDVDAVIARALSGDTQPIVES